MRHHFTRHWHAIPGPHRSRGLAAVEFIISVPILIVAALVAIELGRGFVQYDTLSYSARNAARFVTEHAIEGTTGVVILSGPVIAEAKNLAVYGNESGAGEPKLPGFDVGQVDVLDVGGNNIEVSVAYPYTPMIGGALPIFRPDGWIPLDFTLRVSVIMRAIS